MPLAAGTKLGPYEVISPLGAGGMGEVYKAKDTKLNRLVAIKVLPESLARDPDALSRFEREAHAVAALNHPNILSIHDFGKEGGVAYAVTELLEGETLRSRLEASSLPQRRAVDIAIPIARGLAAAHEKGIIHRDLKPENVFLTSDGRVKILDFGLAKKVAVDAAITNAPTAPAGTEPGTVLGTVGYMSPEQVRGRELDPRTDIFSFGAILYEMLAGKRAFKGDTGIETLNAILKEEPPELLESGRNISPALDRIVRRCLEKSPEARFHSASDLAFDLESVSGASTSRPAVSGKAGGRPMPRPVAIAAAAAIIAAVAAAYGLGRRIERRSTPGSRTFSQLTYRQEPIFNARFAPDGKTVFYASAPSGSTPSIFAVRPGFPGASIFGPPGTALLSVSSKGELAVLTHPKFMRHDVFLGTLARMPLEGGAPREVLDGVREADWSPDGSGLAIIRTVAGKDRLEFPVGTALREVGGYLSNPRFSPSGDRIAFFEHPIKWDDRGLVAVVDLKGNRKVLSEGYWGEEGLAWSRDGREVLFSAGTAYNNFKVYAVDLAGHRRDALESAGGVTVQDVGADGRWLVTRDDFLREMPVFAPGEKAEKDLSWLDLSDAVSLTADGRTLLFNESSGSVGVNYAACLRGTDGSPVVRLGEGFAQDLSRDGKWALVSIPTSPQQLVLDPTGPGETRRLDTGGILSIESARFFPDGANVLACGNEEGHAVRCYVLPVGGGKPRPVTPEGTTDGMVSPDAATILVRQIGGAGLALYPAGGGAPRPVPGSLRDEWVVQWGVDGRSVLVVQAAEMPARIDRLELATGRRTPVRTLGGSRLAGALQLGTVVMTPDEKYYAYSTRVMISRLFLVEGAR
ncbi:MAG TPA: protein kinase [Thermoanaerobaculia bacterium]|nr:protein kinase [Thermoanaerobaculia bacterium]